MPKAAQVLAALKRDGWTEIRRSGSHRRLRGEGMGLRVDYTCDPESPSWCFEVPTLGVMGAADTREGVTTAARDAIRFTLDDEAMGKSRAANDVEYVVVTVNRAMASLP